MNFPHWWDLGRFDQLTAERLVPKRVNGWTVRVWQPKTGRSNEALDCRVYAYAALCGFVQRRNLNLIADQVGAKRTPVVIAGTPEGEAIIAARAGRSAVAIPPPWVIQSPPARGPRSLWIGDRKGWLAR